MSPGITVKILVQPNATDEISAGLLAILRRFGEVTVSYADLAASTKTHQIEIHMRKDGGVTFKAVEL